ncbi:MAG: hypothetical protein JWP41_2342 [Ramlibacter sp.]|nr:hypothetical protein [Ramlibacter sp.]
MKNGVLSFPSMKERCSPQEWQARIDLAACYRLVDIYGMSDMMANHISMRVPDEEGAFLINPYGMMYEEIRGAGGRSHDRRGLHLDAPARTRLPLHAVPQQELEETWNNYQPARGVRTARWSGRRSCASSIAGMGVMPSEAL